jgi:hypothetical protein
LLSIETAMESHVRGAWRRALGVALSGRFGSLLSIPLGSDTTITHSDFRVLVPRDMARVFFPYRVATHGMGVVSVNVVVRSSRASTVPELRKLRSLIEMVSSLAVEVSFRTKGMTLSKDASVSMAYMVEAIY